MAFYENISTPLLVDLALDWGDAKVSDVFPKTLPNIYQGTQLVITGRYKEGGAADITLTGFLNTVKQSFPVKAVFAGESNENLFVSRFWAKAKADDLMLQMQTYGQRSELKDEVIALSKKYQFATPFTSFVAVSTTPVPQVTQQAAARHNARNEPSSARNTSAMARPGSTSGTAPTRTIVRRTEAKSLSLWGASGFLPMALAVPNFRKARQQARGKACFANQRVLMGAIEMYNMDHNEMITELNDHVIDDLVQGKYLKARIVPAEQDCCFGSTGPLNQDGVVICAVHGCPDMPFDANTDPAIKEQVRQGKFYDLGNGGVVSGHVEIRYEGETWFTRIWNSWLADALNLLINVPLFIIGLVFSLYLMYAILSVPFKIIGGILAMFSDKES
jgi:hypothetical protein